MTDQSNNPNRATLETLARLVVAHQAYKGGKIRFAGEVLKGAWDHTNRRDIAATLKILEDTPSVVGEFFASIAARVPDTAP